MDEILFSRQERLALAGGDLRGADAGLRNLEWFAAGGKPLFLFGAGGFGRGMGWTLRQKGGRLIGFFDNNPAQWGELRFEEDGCPVQDPHQAREVMSKYPGAVLLMAVSGADAQKEIREQCEQLGLTLESPVAQYAADPAAAQSAEAREVYDLLADEHSRQVYRQQLRKRSGLEPETAIICEENQYFPSFMPRGLYRSFVDVGALDGDTFRRYLARFGGDFDNYYALEPNAASFQAFHPGPDVWPRLRLFNVAALDQPGVANLWENHSVSRLTEEGNGRQVTTARLDALLAGWPVTFIKLDIEGSEMQALAGAEGIIGERKPALAVSVYHYFQHFWQAPLLLKKLHPGYRLYFRHHSRYEPETICYAVP
ncbi:MAG: FkbM family methyltransferase [Planctomycetes bacterium]|nr:FkbM family methyltransferase [Planctomycetota bacterium]